MAMKRITELTRDCFNAISQMREAQEGIAPSAEILHQRLRGFIDALLERGPKDGFQERDVQDIAYAIVALADEMALGISENVRRYWMGNLLQLRYFNENVAGDGFFLRLDGIRRDPRRLEVLEVYYLCLLFGFQGKFAVRGGEIELMNLVELLKTELGQALDIPDELSPSGERPDDVVLKGARRAPVILIAAGALALAVTVYVALRVSIAGQAESARDRIAETGR
jgi:type VI secretion system protein ImpK